MCIHSYHSRFTSGTFLYLHCLRFDYSSQTASFTWAHVNPLTKSLKPIPKPRIISRSSEEIPQMLHRRYFIISELLNLAHIPSNRSAGAGRSDEKNQACRAETIWALDTVCESWQVHAEPVVVRNYSRTV